MFGISHGSVRNTLKKSKFHPYKLKIVQELHANDYATRMTFAEEMIDKILHSQDFLCHIMFSNEAHFHLHGGVNTRNCRYWSNTNPHWTAEKPLHFPRTTVWAAIWDDTVDSLKSEENITQIHAQSSTTNNPEERMHDNSICFVNALLSNIT